MKRFAVGLSATLVLVAVALFYGVRQPAAPHPGQKTEQPPTRQSTDNPEPASAPPATAVDTVRSKEPVAPQASTEPRPRYARLTIAPGQPIPELNPFQAERDQLLNLAASQDARQIPKIAASLSHPNATVRETARQALLQLGDPAAVPALVEAAKKSPPEEAALLTEAAEFLSLPKLMEVIGNPNPPESGLAPPPAP